MIDNRTFLLIKNSLLMKKMILLVMGVAAMLCTTACSKGHCYIYDDKPYYCAGYDKCCPYPYYAGGVNLCYQSLSRCRADGYYCTTCSLED